MQVNYDKLKADGNLPPPTGPIQRTNKLPKKKQQFDLKSLNYDPTKGPPNGPLQNTGPLESHKTQPAPTDPAKKQTSGGGMDPKAPGPQPPRLGFEKMSDLRPEDTVEERLNKLLADDSKYIQRARAGAAEQAAARGLLNSSLAAGAGEAAAIDAALPIASQDASQGFQSRQGWLDFMRQSGLSTQDFLQTKKLSQLGYKQEKGLANQAFQHSKKLANIDAKNQTKLQTKLQQMRNKGAMDLETLRQRAVEMQLTKNMQQSYTRQMSSLQEQMNDEIARIQQTQGLSAAQQQEAVRKAKERYEQSFQFLENMYNTMKDIDWS